MLVTRTLTSTDGGNAYDWRVTFARARGDVDDMTAARAAHGTRRTSGLDRGTRARTPSAAPSRSPSAARRRRALPYDASAAVVEAELESLSTIGPKGVAVTRAAWDGWPRSSAGFRWDVSFTTLGRRLGAALSGAVALLEASSSLSGASPQATVDELGRGVRADGQDVELGALRPAVHERRRAVRIPRAAAGRRGRADGPVERRQRR